MTTIASEGVRIEYVPLDEVRRWPRNPKDHDLGLLHRSIRKFGFIQPLLIDEATGFLVAGHGRVDTLAQKRGRGEKAPLGIRVGEDGAWLVPVIRGIAFGSQEEAEAYLLADNRVSEVGGWNEDVLATVLADHAKDLDGIGWDGEDVDRLIKRIAGEGGGGPGEREIAPELFERHDYIVFYFDNDIDWQRAFALFNLQTQQTAQVGKKSGRVAEQTGIGRVLAGKILLEKLKDIEP